MIKELGRHNCYPNYGIDERVFMLRVLITHALRTETIRDVIRSYPSTVATLRSEYAQQRKEIMLVEQAPLTPNPLQPSG